MIPCAHFYMKNGGGIPGTVVAQYNSSHKALPRTITSTDAFTYFQPKKWSSLSKIFTPVGSVHTAPFISVFLLQVIDFFFFFKANTVCVKTYLHFYHKCFIYVGTEPNCDKKEKAIATVTDPVRAFPLTPYPKPQVLMSLHQTFISSFKRPYWLGPKKKNSVSDRNVCREARGSERRYHGPPIVAWVRNLNSSERTSPTLLNYLGV